MFFIKLWIYKVDEIIGTTIKKSFEIKKNIPYVNKTRIIVQKRFFIKLFDQKSSRPLNLNQRLPDESSYLFYFPSCVVEKYPHFINLNKQKINSNIGKKIKFLIFFRNFLITFSLNNYIVLLKKNSIKKEYEELKIMCGSVLESYKPNKQGVETFKMYVSILKRYKTNKWGIETLKGGERGIFLLGGFNGWDILEELAICSYSYRMIEISTVHAKIGIVFEKIFILEDLVILYKYGQLLFFINTMDLKKEEIDELSNTELSLKISKVLYDNHIIFFN